jgi:hypothetical protein
LRTELASIIASQRQDVVVFNEQMRKFNQTIRKLESTEHLVAAKEREMKYFIESRVQKMLAEKRLKIKRLINEYSKLVPAPQPVRLEPWVDDEEETMDCDQNDEAEVCEEDYDGDED